MFELYIPTVDIKYLTDMRNLFRVASGNKYGAKLIFVETIFTPTEEYWKVEYRVESFEKSDLNEFEKYVKSEVGEFSSFFNGFNGLDRVYLFVAGNQTIRSNRNMTKVKSPSKKKRDMLRKKKFLKKIKLKEDQAISLKAGKLDSVPVQQKFNKYSSYLRANHSKVSRMGLYFGRFKKAGDFGKSSDVQIKSESKSEEVKSSSSTSTKRYNMVEHLLECSFSYDNLYIKGLFADEQMLKMIIVYLECLHHFDYDGTCSSVETRLTCEMKPKSNILPIDDNDTLTS